MPLFPPVPLSTTITGTVPLPSGASKESKQLADGHNVAEAPRTSKMSAEATVTSSADVSVIAAVAAKKLRILSLLVCNTSTTVTTYVEFSDDNGSTWKNKTNLRPGATFQAHFYNWQTDTVNEAFKAQAGAAVTSIYVTAEYEEV